MSPLATRRAGSCDPSDTWNTVGSNSCLATGEHLLEVLVAAAAQTHEHVRLVELARPRECVRRLERGDDSLASRQRAKRLERLFVRRAQVLRAPAVPQRRVLGADARIVEAGGDRVRVEDLPVRVGEDRRACAVEDTPRDRTRATPRRTPRSRRAARLRRRGTPRTSRSRSSRRRRTRRRPPAAAPPPRGTARAPRGR